MQLVPNTIGNLSNSLTQFVWFYLRQKKLFLLGYFLTGLFWAIELSLSPYLLKSIIDVVSLHQQDVARLWQWLFWPAGLYLSMSLLLNVNFRIFNYLNIQFFPALKRQVTMDLFAYLMHHAYSFFQNNFSGSLTKRIQDMAISIEELINIPNIWFFPRIWALLIASAMLYWVVEPVFACILLVWAVLFLWASYRAAVQAVRYANDCAWAVNQMEGVLVDSVTNVLSTKIFSKIKHEINYLKGKVDVVVERDRAMQWFNLRINAVQSFAVTVLTAGMLYALIEGRIAGSITVGDFALVLSLCVSIVMAVWCFQAWI